MELNLVTWNVNGIRTRIFDNNKSTTCKLNNKLVQPDSSLFNLLQMTSADFLCFQETRCSVLNGKCLNIEDYISIFNESKEDGARSSNRYSGTAMYIKKTIKINQILFQIPNQIDGEEYIDTEGRIIIVYFGEQNENVIVNVYTPNSGTNFEKRLKFQNAMLAFLACENLKRNVIYTGDLNVAYLSHDCHYKYLKSSTYKRITKPVVGMIPEEIEFINELLSINFKDSFLELNKNNINVKTQLPANFKGFTWWDPRMKKTFDEKTQTNMSIFRSKNLGWRIDYTFLSKNIQVLESLVLKSIGEYTEPNASDHAPLYTKIKI